MLTCKSISSRNDYTYDKKTRNVQANFQDRKRQYRRYETSSYHQNSSPSKSNRSAEESRKGESIDGVDYERQIPIPILLGYPSIFKRD